jgi:hypothetical protein
MKDAIEDLYKKAEEVKSKYKDAELYDYMLSLAQKLQDADVMYHHFGYLLMHVRASIAHQVRPPHLQDAIERAHQLLKRYDERKDTKAG